MLLALLILCQQALPIDESKVIDLTHAFNDKAVFWPTADGFHMDIVFRGETDGGYHYEANNIRLAEHGGTHLDAPIHFFEGRMTVEQIPLSQLMGPAFVIDVSNAALKNPDYLVSVADLENFEARHGTIPAGAMVMIHTGYGKFWPDRKAYMGTAERGADAVAKLHFPGLSPEAATWLARRKVDAVGLDTPSIDYGQSKLFKSHRILYEQNISGLENVANLDKLPPTGAFVVAMPMKIEGGSGAPLRIFAILP